MAQTKKVTRITATDDAPKKAAKPAKVVKTKTAKPRKTDTPVVSIDDTTNRKNIFARIGNYFKGAWIELRQVRWPNRKATWTLTLAVIIFSLFFVLLIVLLDTFFKYIFELIIV